MEKKVERVWKIRKIMKAAKGQLLGMRIFLSRTNLMSVANRITVAAK